MSIMPRNIFTSNNTDFFLCSFDSDFFLYLKLRILPAAHPTYDSFQIKTTVNLRFHIVFILLFDNAHAIIVSYLADWVF
jgi:hypothetical protein